MIAVIFEVYPNSRFRQEYLNIAADLAKSLAAVEGFISIERFESLSHPGKLLSLSFWRDENAVAAWRDHQAHRLAQATGRHHIFDAYRLRVAHVMRDYGKFERDQAPADSRAVHEQPLSSY